MALGVDAYFEILDGQDPIVIKETFGPFIPEEAELDPLSILLENGYPPEKIKVITMLRSPQRVCSSWQRCFGSEWSGEVEVEMFVRSYSRARETYEAAQRQNIAVVAYAPDALCDFDVYSILERLFVRVGLQLTRGALEWKKHPPFDAPNSRIIREREPEMFRIAGIIDSVKSSESYRDPVASEVSTSDQSLKLSIGRLSAEYEALRERTYVDLEVER